MTYSTTFLTALCSSALLSRLQHVQAEILQGCAAVHCPNQYADMLSPTCQVVDTDMRLIGLMNTQSDLVNDLTWTVGDSGLQSTIAGDKRTVTRSFFLGTPFWIDLTSSNLSFKGCAIFVVSPETGAIRLMAKALHNILVLHPVLGQRVRTASKICMPKLLNWRVPVRIQMCLLSARPSQSVSRTTRLRAATFPVSSLASKQLH